jgi:hypothetical protein
MKILIIDDTPSHWRLLRQALQEGGHVVVVAPDVTGAWNWIAKGDRFDLMVIDLALDRRAQEFQVEMKLINDALTASGYDGLPVSGQALGLRLWQRRQELMQRYCYASNHLQLWMEGLGKEEKEFSGLDRNAVSPLLLDKSSLWKRNIEQYLNDAIQAWIGHQWIEGSEEPSA